ncbi:NUDIX hydrolase [Salinithrix halophila]|uniref:NUDIX domain-containing protein n=1 Tax=Salinithrix halophila TaxID=1485204 RepID=A0ABV8JBY0_9BACL
MQEERIDVLDETMTVQGNATRTEIHRKGLWHRTFHCWVLRREGDRKRLIFQLRDKGKQASPGKMDASAAGHLEAGETPEDGVREMEEELGMAIRPEELRFLGVSREEKALGEGWMDREFCHLYFYETACSLQAFSPQPGEVAGLFEADAIKAAAFFQGEIDCLQVVGFTLGGSEEKRRLVKEDLAPHSDAYYRMVGEALYSICGSK